MWSEQMSIDNYEQVLLPSDAGVYAFLEVNCRGNTVENVYVGRSNDIYRRVNNEHLAYNSDISDSLERAKSAAKRRGNKLVVECRRCKDPVKAEKNQLKNYDWKLNKRR